MKNLQCLLLLLVLTMCFSSKLLAAEPMCIYVTVDWEGRSLEEDNLQAMRDFRKAFPYIPLLHLLNPVYALRPGVDAEQLTRFVRSTFLPGDGEGLHLHGWKSLMDYCQLPYRSSPSFLGLDENCENECGYTVSLEAAYSAEELTQLVACSSDLLVQQGFLRPRAFRAGGWQAGEKLIAALKANHFTWDSSRIDYRILTSRWHKDSPLVRFLQVLHPGSSVLDQPYALGGGLTEYPNNAGLADYTSTKQIVKIFKELLVKRKSVMVLGFHQETAATYLDALADAIPQIQTLAADAGVELQWVK